MVACEDFIGRIRRFNRFYTAFLGVLDRHFLESPYSLTQVRVLYEICHGSESCARDIGVSLRVDRGYLSRIIDSFIMRGLVRKSPSSQDRRQHIIALTQKGKEVFGELEARSEQSIARAIETLSREQRDELARHMERITIRTEFVPGDIGYVIHRHGTLYAREYGYGLQFEAYVAKGLAEFMERYNPKTNRVWVCEHKGRMVGFLLLMNRGEAAQLRYFLIEPEYRGIGLGQRFVTLFMEFLRACGYQAAYLWTTDELAAAA